MSTFLRCSCASLLVSISSAVTQLSYTSSSPAPSSVTCADGTGCEIACVGDNSCDEATFNSQTASYLTITAEGFQVLYMSYVYCPSDGMCDIYVGGEQALRLSWFYADSSAKLTITASGGFWALGTVNIYCPRSSQQTPSCIIRLQSDSSPFWSSTNGGPIMSNTYMYIDSADDVEFQCDANVEWGQLFEWDTSWPNDIFYYTDVARSVCSMQLGAYSTSDFFGTNTLECIYKEKGTDYNLLANKRCVPWSTASPSSSSGTTEPSLSPSNLPSESPTMKPSVSPTKSPNNDPSLEPVIDPTVDPTFDPTFYPTFHPTFYPTFYPTLTQTYDPTIDLTKDPTKPTTVLTNDPTADPTTDPMIDTTKINLTPTMEQDIDSDVEKEVNDNNLIYILLAVTTPILIIVLIYIYCRLRNKAQDNEHMVEHEVAPQPQRRKELNTADIADEAGNKRKASEGRTRNNFEGGCVIKKDKEKVITAGYGLEGIVRDKSEDNGANPTETERTTNNKTTGFDV